MDAGASSISGVNEETLGHYQAVGGGLTTCSSEGVPACGRRLEWDTLQDPSQSKPFCDSVLPHFTWTKIRHQAYLKKGVFPHLMYFFPGNTHLSNFNVFLVLRPCFSPRGKAGSAFAGLFEAVPHTHGGGGGSCSVLASPWCWGLVSRNS